MNNIRPRSGILRKGVTQQRQSSTKYEQRRYSKQICKSINILPIKIQNQLSGNCTQTLKTINMNSTKTTPLNRQNDKKRTLLSIKTKQNLRIQNSEQFKLFLEQDQISTQTRIPRRVQKRTSIDLTNFNNNNNNFSIEDDTDKMFELMRNKKEIMMLDHTRLVIEATKFKSLLNDFQSKFNEVKTDRNNLEQKVNKYEHYFKEMRLKHVPQTNDEENSEANHQLKILNLEKKVQTLNYIIKQYRTSNNQEVKHFQQKLKEFKPNIQRELTQKLAETNQKYEKLLQKVQFFEKQCKNNLNIDWQQLMTEFKQNKEENEKNLTYISDLTDKLNEFNNILAQNQEKIRLIQQLESKTLEQKQKIQLLNDKKFQLQEEIQQKDQKIDEINHLLEQTSFKLQGLKNLQFKIEYKENTIKKNTIIINRLQCQNIELQSKMNTVLSEFQQRVFCEKGLQQSLLKANNNIHDIKNRLHDAFISLSENASTQTVQEKECFIGHLFQKINVSYNKIISEYQNQLKLTNSQCQKWKETFGMISKNQQERIKFVQTIDVQVKKIQQKKLRCQQHFNNLSNMALDSSIKQCINCKHFIAYWGQLQNSYNQLKNIAQKVLKVQSINSTTPNEALESN